MAFKQPQNAGKTMQRMHDFMRKDLVPTPNLARTVPGWPRRRFLQTVMAVACAPQAYASLKTSAKTLKLAVASDLRAALPHVLQQFTAQTGVLVQASYGSSGNFARQIQQGLPVDVFMSADQNWVQLLARAGLTQSEAWVYAMGRLAWISAKIAAAPQGHLPTLLQQLRQAQGKLAIAHPDHAPYGRAAVQVLQKLGEWDVVKPHVVYGDNVAQAMQFASTGAASAAITALPLVRGPNNGFSGHVLPIDPQWHDPLTQQMVILKNAAPEAQLFLSHMQTDAVRQHLQAQGFGLPESKAHK